MPLSVLRGQRSPAQKWTTSDGRLAVALEEYEGMIHGPCGHPLHEGLDPESEGEWFAPEPSRCLPCTVIAERAKGYSEQRTPQALMFSAERRRRPESKS